MRISFLLGYLYEIAFKVGFIKRIEQIVKSPIHGFISLEQFLQQAKHFLIEQNEEVWKDLEKIWHGFQASAESPLSDTDTDYSSHDLSPEQEKALYIFKTGELQGYFYAKEHPPEIIHKLRIGEASHIPGSWENADLIFQVQGTLYVLEFKLGGAARHLHTLFHSEDPPVLPFFDHGIALHLSPGRISLDRVIAGLLQNCEAFTATTQISPEANAFLQVLAYAISFLIENDSGNRHSPIQRLHLSILSPFTDPLCFEVDIESYDSLPQNLEAIRRLYEELSERLSAYQRLQGASKTREMRLTEEYEEKIRQANDEISRLEAKPTRLTPMPISEARRDVERRITDFFERKDPRGVLVLLHAPGAGKTTTLRNYILRLSEGKHIVIYFASRLILCSREEEKLKQDPKVYVVRATSTKTPSPFVRDNGQHWQNLSSHKGVLAELSDNLHRATVNNANQPKQFLWGIATLQAITKNERGQSTLTHLDKLKSPRIIDQYTLHIIADEFFGHYNGMDAIIQLIHFMKKWYESGGRGYLYLFDANAYSPELFVKLYEEYKQYKAIPASLMLTHFQPELHTELEGIPAYIYARHGYPAPDIQTQARFFLNIEEENELIQELARYIQRTFPQDKRESAFLFIQNKDRIAKLRRELTNIGFSCIIATSSSQRSQDEISQGNEDIILGTSSISRGIDLSRPHKPVTHIYFLLDGWNSEENLVELLQSLARARGDSETEQRTRIIHRMYIAPIRTPERENEVVQSIMQEWELADEALTRLIYRYHIYQGLLNLDKVACLLLAQFVGQPGKNLMVPVPKFYETQFKYNPIAELEGNISFLEDVLLIENKNTDSTPIIERLKYIIETLQQFSFYSESLTTEKIEEGEYYHPYLLFTHMPMRISRPELKIELLSNNLKEVEGRLREHSTERTRRLKEFISNPPHSLEKADAAVLIPTYTYVWTRYFLRREGTVLCKVRPSVGRGGAEVLGGDAGLQVRAKNSISSASSREYPFIPLQENFPYTQVLSGRFPRFPIELVLAILQYGRDSA
ncbi:MAG: hypothetical protein NZ580_03810 [Bacteroidia bacterium]|nr:hypothetical protein [Bacteroidia bacterium]MDW8235454.1 hypothetical protein [Bacteroidia bacterium]